MDNLHRLGTNVANIHLRGDDDIVDKIHRVYTAFILVICAIIVSGKQYFGEPIYCWLPEKVTQFGHQRYAENVCWISNTYWIPFEKGIPVDLQHRHQHEIPYYPWIPLLLLIQAVGFCIPYGFWRMINERSGINAAVVVEMASSNIKAIQPEARQRSIKSIANYIKMALNYQVRIRKRRKSIFCEMLSKVNLVCGRRYGNYLSSTYFWTKILYMINASAQFYLTHHMLEESNVHQEEKTQDIVWEVFKHDQHWMHHGKFPRVSMCDFSIRVLGNVHRHTIQCVLTINFFNEKTYVFLWIWLIVLLFLTFINILTWLYKIHSYRNRNHFIAKDLRLSDLADLSEFENKIYQQFHRDFLRLDGVFLFHLITKNANHVVARDILYELWTDYKDQFIEEMKTNTNSNANI